MDGKQAQSRATGTHTITLSACALLQVRDLYWTVRNFRNRVADFLRYRCVSLASLVPAWLPRAALDGASRQHLMLHALCACVA